MSAMAKLMQARIQLINTDLKKSGKNAFAGYSYFELGDFLHPIMRIFDDLKLAGVISFGTDLATLTIVDLEDGSEVVITSPMAGCALKGCHDVQNLGASQTYLRRYLWVTALEIVEHDAIDLRMNPDEPFVDALKEAAQNGEESLKAKWREIAKKMNTKEQTTFWGKYSAELKEIANAATN